MPILLNTVCAVADSLMLVNTFFGAALFIALIPSPSKFTVEAVISLCLFILSLFCAFWAKVCIHYHPASHADLARSHDYDRLLARVIAQYPVVACLIRCYNPPLLLLVSVALMLGGMGVFLFGVVCTAMPTPASSHVCWAMSAVTFAPVVLFAVTVPCVWYLAGCGRLWEQLMTLRVFARGFDARMDEYSHPAHAVDVDQALIALADERSQRVQLIGGSQSFTALVIEPSRAEERKEAGVQTAVEELARVENQEQDGEQYKDEEEEKKNMAIV